MAITRWDPFGEISLMQREIDRLFGRLGPGRVDPAAPATVWVPRIDVKTTGDDMIVYAELPGMRREDIDVQVTDGSLTIQGTSPVDTDAEGEKWLIRERGSGSFERTLGLPEGIEPEKIAAEYTDGILTIRIPRAVAAMRPKTYRVALASGAR